MAIVAFDAMRQAFLPDAGATGRPLQDVQRLLHHARHPVTSAPADGR
jgi:hypothetical protein